MKKEYIVDSEAFRQKKERQDRKTEAQRRNREQRQAQKALYRQRSKDIEVQAR